MPYHTRSACNTRGCWSRGVYETGFEGSMKPAAERTLVVRLLPHLVTVLGQISQDTVHICPQCAAIHKRLLVLMKEPDASDTTLVVKGYTSCVHLHSNKHTAHDSQPLPTRNFSLEHSVQINVSRLQ